MPQPGAGYDIPQPDDHTSDANAPNTVVEQQLSWEEQTRFPDYDNNYEQYTAADSVSSSHDAYLFDYDDVLRKDKQRNGFLDEIERQRETDVNTLHGVSDVTWDAFSHIEQPAATEGLLTGSSTDVGTPHAQWKAEEKKRRFLEWKKRHEHDLAAGSSNWDRGTGDDVMASSKTDAHRQAEVADWSSVNQQQKPHTDSSANAAAAAAAAAAAGKQV